MTEHSYQFYTAEDFILPYVSFNKRIELIVSGITPENREKVVEKLTTSYGKNVAVKDANGNAISVDLIGVLADKIFVDAVDLVKRERFDFSDLEEIMKKLRGEGGCEWDRAQTHKSIRINLIEEAYELVEGIDKESAEMMLEETGDVMLQAIFHSEIAEESEEFSIIDMFTRLCRKLLDRHTHIFGENHANNAEEALAFWTEAKKKEKGYSSFTDQMERVPNNFPALLYAEKIQKIAKKSGFDWNDVEGAVEKAKEELDELLSADKEHKTEEGGDLLFAVVNVLRFFKVEPEIALREANAKFLKRYKVVEELATKDGKDMKDYTLQELDAFWDIAKEQEKQN